MNVFTATGNIGNAAETRYLPSGAAVANFSLAVKSGYGDKAQTMWVRCALFGKRAEGGLIEYLIKGAQVAVSGELSTREWKNNEGETKTSIELKVNELTLLGGGKRETHSEPRQAVKPQPAADVELNDDIPF
jgi:single-strand DNA-binding protein